LALSRRGSLKAIAAAAAFPAAARAADSGGADANRPDRQAIKLVVLDIGGTIIQDHGEVPRAMQSALGHRGVAASLAEINDWRGASKREMVRHFVEQRTKPDAKRAALIDAIYGDFSAQVNEAYAKVQPIVGAEDAIRAMRKSGLLVATTTGFDRQTTDLIFRRLGWHDYFVATVASDEVAEGRPAPFMLFHAMESARVQNVMEVVAVGDTPLDLQAGNNGGLRGVIGVFSGAATAERLRQERHTHILPSVAELPELLNSQF
jgi:phosphonatase-like hydrolase